MPGQVAVADVVLAAARGEAAVAVGRQDHVGRVDVGAVLLLGEAEREDRAVLEQLGGAAACGRVVALPDRAEPEDRDLPRVPVRQAVEAGDLAERADARGVPALVRVAGRFRRGRQQRREDALALDELQEVGVPGALVIVLLERRLAARLEEVDRRQQRSASRLVEVGRIVRARIEQEGLGPSSDAGVRRRQDVARRWPCLLSWIVYRDWSRRGGGVRLAGET